VSEPVRLRVYGTPGPQGSKKHVGGGRMVESSKKVGPWREAVTTAAQMAGVAGLRLDGPLLLRVEFVLRRPKSHYTTKGALKPDAPYWVTTTPDLDKLLRSTKDGLVQAGVICDDKLVAAGGQHKRYASEGETPGAIVEITRLVEGAC
jgi:crossover junction endodeoxyribonuclease RusA